jgi:UTP-glucose-1-phosphate uridylyltransferase
MIPQMENLEFVILAAGKSTRNYPQSKGLPHKTLLPLGDAKVIDAILSQIIDAGGKHVTIVISDTDAQKAFEKNFVPDPEVEAKFKSSGNIIGLELLRSIRIPEDVNIKYVLQPTPRGTGHAAALAYRKIKNSGRAMVMSWSDDVILSKGPSVYRRAIKEFESTGCRGNIVVTRRVEDPSRWGIVEDGFYVEKPKESKSNEAGIGFCIFDRAVCLELLKDVEQHDGEKEMTFIPSLNRVIEQDPGVMKIRTIPLAENDKYLDCGNIKEYEKALIYSLLKHSKFADENTEFVKRLIK